MVHNCLDINETDLQDKEDIIKPLESLATRKDNEFFGSHFSEIEKITEPSEADSDLRKELKRHIKEELLTVNVLRVIVKCKSIVTFFKTSGLNDKLEGGSLKQEAETRWMSVLIMLRSFFSSSSSKVTADQKFSQVKFSLTSHYCF